MAGAQYRSLLGLALAGLLVSGGVCASAAEEVDEEKARAVQAAYLFNFAKFVSWPAERFAGAQSPIVIGIVGNSKLVTALSEAVKGKLAQERPVAVKSLEVRAAEGEGRVAFDECHILFLDESVKKQLPGILRQLEKASILTVSSQGRFCEEGGDLELKLQGGKYLLRANPERMKGRSIQISSKLLRLAEIVQRKS